MHLLSYDANKEKQWDKVYGRDHEKATCKKPFYQLFHEKRLCQLHGRETFKYSNHKQDL